MNQNIEIKKKTTTTKTTELIIDTESTEPKPRKSVVRVYFMDINQSYSYYNDLFDLKKGDIVYVDGKLEGIRGIVTGVNYSFKIKLSEYKKVIFKVDTKITGEFYPIENMYRSTDQSTLNFEKVLLWFKAPTEAGDIIVSSSDDKKYKLNYLKDTDINEPIFYRGKNYFEDDRVIFLEINGTHGKAIVEGTEYYTVEFDLNGDEVSGIVCDCFCTDICKHEVAVMLQLEQLLNTIRETQHPSISFINKKTLLTAILNHGNDNSIIVK